MSFNRTRGFFIYFINIIALIEDFNRELKFFLDLRYTRKEFYKNNYIMNSTHIIPTPIVQGKVYTYIVNFLGITIINISLVTIITYFIVKERQYI